jgi:ATP-binding cassette, subfamily B, bacterial
LPLAVVSRLLKSKKADAMNKSWARIIKKIYGHAFPFLPHMMGIIVLNLVSIPLVLLNPVPLKIVVDNAIGDDPIPDLLKNLLPAAFDYTFNGVLLVAVAMVILISLLKNLQGLFLWILQSYAGEKLVLSFRNSIFGHIQKMSLTYHDRVGISDSIYRIQYDASAIRDLVLNAFSPLITAIFTIFGMIYIMFGIQWEIALVAIFIVPFLFIITKYSSSRLKKSWHQVKSHESSAMSVIHETLSSLRVVKAFVKEDHHQNSFMNKSNLAVKEQIKVAFIGGGFDLLVGLLIALGTAIVLFIGARSVQQGNISVGDLVLVMAYLAQLFGPMTTISKQINFLQSSFAGLERALTLIEGKEDIEEDPNPLTIKRLQGNVIFNDVTFSYKNEQPVIENTLFHIRAGQKVGIVGPTGSGKSTILSLLARFYEPTSGHILVDGTDIRKYKLSDYRNQFGIVLQEPVLFSTTIAENIAYGKINATMDEIVDAAKAANAHKFISAFPDAYETQVGERGMQISGGERQRISLARAFLKNAPMLILDEPTSAVDANTESIIMEAIDRLMEGRTTFLVTHRLDTLSKCDMIIHLESGRVIDMVLNDHTSILNDKISSLRKKSTA